MECNRAWTARDATVLRQAEKVGAWCERLSETRRDNLQESAKSLFHNYISSANATTRVPTKIREFDVALSVDEYVFRLQISMNDATLMTFVQTCAQNHERTVGIAIRMQGRAFEKTLQDLINYKVRVFDMPLLMHKRTQRFWTVFHAHEDRILVVMGAKQFDNVWTPLKLTKDHNFSHCLSGYALCICQPWQLFERIEASICVVHEIYVTIHSLTQ